MTRLKLHSDFSPAGDQPEAIGKLAKGVEKEGMQTLLGVTGSGKTFSIASVLAKTNRTALVISHNKTLAAQLYSEFRDFFPENKVGYFVSYYDYYQPESYIPQSDTYIEKDAQVNEKIERLRLAATAALAGGEPCIIVATVSCIYGIGSPEEWKKMTFEIRKGARIARSSFLAKLVSMQYERNDMALSSGKFRAKGDTIEIMPSYSEEVVRVSLSGDGVESITIMDGQNRKMISTPSSFILFPAKHYLVPEGQREKAIKEIEAELEQRLPEMEEMSAYRLKTRTKYDLELIKEIGYCNGIENYSRHFDGRNPGEPPYCLLDYLPKDALVVIDESHVTLPQLHGMQKGDRSRKKALIDYGFRLPSAYDNRPLTFEEFEGKLKGKSAIFVSATPAEYERTRSSQIVEQLVRPTGLLDPSVEVRPTFGQVEDLIKEVKNRAEAGERTLVTTLTKRMAEDLAERLVSEGVKARYLHAEIETLQRSEIIRQLRLGEFDCLVGINLLREGLDLPEVSLVAIFDADKQGFLRTETSLIQTIGRTARNLNAHAIMYADGISEAMQKAIDETERRRKVQEEYNREHGITPKSIVKKIKERISAYEEEGKGKGREEERLELEEEIIILEEEMKQAAETLEFEKAIELRDRLSELKRMKKGRRKKS
ncbi:excinuclease ABC subunit B [Candidatus Micrarchaeota archaeon CG1_02_47_40]|nr:MAG: excinuclease ABC subunit B [Candidatus Micrarchaeota archaeon CG1_02_47_40]